MLQTKGLHLHHNHSLVRYLGDFKLQENSHGIEPAADKHSHREAFVERPEQRGNDAQGEDSGQGDGHAANLGQEVAAAQPADGGPVATRAGLDHDGRQKDELGAGHHRGQEEGSRIGHQYHLEDEVVAVLGNGQGVYVVSYSVT